MLTARAETTAFQIWQFCKPREWNATLTEISKAVGKPKKTVSAILHVKNWNNRIRVEV